MSTNCLKTQLKAVVNNDNLDKFGAVKLMFDADTSANTIFTISTVAPVVCEVFGDNCYFTLNNTNVGTKITVNSSVKNYYNIVHNGPYYVIIDNYYGLKVFDTSITRYEMCIPIKKMNYLDSNLAVLSTRALYGNLSDCNKTFRSITELYYWDLNHIKGDIKTIADIAPEVEKIRFENNVNNAVTGDLKDLITGFIANGRTSENKVTIALFQPSIYFFGVAKSYLMNATLTWESSTKALLVNNNTVASYNVILAKGYTTEEMDVLTGEGGTYEGKSYQIVE